MEFWYSKNEKEIEKYKYLIMLDLKPGELKELEKKDRLVKEYKMIVEIVNNDPNFTRRISEEEDRRMCYNSDIRIATKKGAKQNSLEIAKKMLQIPNITIDQIATCTNLSLEEIATLKEE